MAADDEQSSAGASLLEQEETGTSIASTRSRNDYSASLSIRPRWLPDTTPSAPAPTSPTPSSLLRFSQAQCHAVRRKLDTHLVPLLFLLYFLSFIDRSNIGNARLAGLDRDLSISDEQFTWLLRSFYFTYIAFEWMTFLYRVVKPHIYVSLCVVAWGGVASLQAVATGYRGLLACRLFLGIAEAAFGPGVPFYLSSFYRREELAYRVGWFISAAPLASSVAGLAAWVIVQMAAYVGIQSWRLLFLLEGFPTVVVGVGCWWSIPDGPGSARWWNGREGEVAVWRLGGQGQDRHGVGTRQESSGASDWDRTRARKTPRTRALDWSAIIATLRDPRNYVTACMFFSCNVAFSSMPVFGPAIVNAMGFNSTKAQVYSALPHFIAFLVVLLVSYLSDRYRSRSLFIMLVAFFSMVGYAVLSISPALGMPPLIKYLCLFPINAGFFSAVTLTIVWTLDNQNSESAKGAGVVLINVIGQTGPFLGTALYPETARPGYVKGHAVCAAFMGLAMVLSFVLRLVLKRRNESTAHDYDLVQEMRDYHGREENDGDDASGGRERFVYML